MNIRKQAVGFTLIEMILTIVIMGILGAFGFSFISFLSNTYGIMKDERGIQQEGAYIIERIARELRDATLVTSGTNSASITLQHDTPASGSKNASYLRSSNTLRRNDVIIGEKITYFSIDPVAVDTATCYKVTLKAENAGVTRNFETTVCPRNLAGDSTGYKGDYHDTY